MSRQDTAESIREYRAKRAAEKARRDETIVEIADYLGVPAEKVRVVLEFLFSDLPLDLPAEKRRRR